MNVTLYMESYCPYCKNFVSKELKNLMAAPGLKDMVDLHLEPGVYAQSKKDKKTGRTKWSCLHGATIFSSPATCHGNTNGLYTGHKECELDRLQLCVLNPLFGRTQSMSWHWTALF